MVEQLFSVQEQKAGLRDVRLMSKIPDQSQNMRLPSILVPQIQIELNWKSFSGITCSSMSYLRC